MSDTFIPEFYTKPTLVLGCGNTLFGDDGFGPAVIKYLEEKYKIPEDTCVVDAGTGVREILFTLALGENKPKRIIIVDAMELGKEPGQVFEVNLEDIPENKIDDFSLHQLPTSNLLKELRDLCKVDVRILAAQVKDIPEIVKPGLSPALSDAVPVACKMGMEIVRRK